jgi:O-6-methylguanine DNA methyltransferase
MSTISIGTISTPLGEMHIGVSKKGVCFLEFVNKARVENHINTLSRDHKIVEEQSNKIIQQTQTEINQYFNKALVTFTVPLDFVGTDFQCAVWNSLLDISFGQTRTYLDQAKTIGDVKAIRAVATTNGKNRIAIIVPCHRVIGSDGSLTGYAGELWRKKKLLELESNQGSLF